MPTCDIQAEAGGWYCEIHDCYMAGAKPPETCLKVRPLTSKERLWLQKEQRRLGYRQIIGTLTRDDRKRLQDIKTLLTPS